MGKLEYEVGKLNETAEFRCKGWCHSYELRCKGWCHDPNSMYNEVSLPDSKQFI